LSKLPANPYGSTWSCSSPADPCRFQDMRSSITYYKALQYTSCKNGLTDTTICKTRLAMHVLRTRILAYSHVFLVEWSSLQLHHSRSTNTCPAPALTTASPQQIHQHLSSTCPDHPLLADEPCQCVPWGTPFCGQKCVEDSMELSVMQALSQGCCVEKEGVVFRVDLSSVQDSQISQGGVQGGGW